MIIDNIIFQTQYYIDSLNLNSTYNLNLYTIFLIIITGVITGFNPCALSIIPIYLNYINQDTKKSQSTIIIFSSGIITSLSIIGILSIIIGKYINLLGNFFTVIAGFITIILGLNYLHVLPSFTIKSNKLNPIIKYFERIIKISPYINGLIFGLTISSCSTPIIFSISLWIIKNQNLLLGFFLIILYSFGYSLPLIVISLTINKIENKIQQYLSNEWIYLFNGFILTSIGTTYCLSILRT